ncbi:hypothetical protein NCC49_003620 [Naganishia albida]|nr:hypothetical protein NCC49_003620 [Naganishia albida]
MISLLKPSSSSQSTGSTHTSNTRDSRRASLVSRMGIGVDSKETQSPPLVPQPEDSKAPASPLLDDHAHSAGILIHHDGPGQHDPSAGMKRLSLTGDFLDSALSPPPQETSTLPISPALSANVQLINNAHEKIPADQLPPTVRPGVPVRAASKIRFAPLPNPRRQRSMSTGRNIAITATMQSDGTRTLQRHARMDKDEASYFSNPENAPESGYGDEQAVDDEEYEENEDEDGEKKRSWKTMGMGSWKSGSFSSGSYTKKLLKPLLSPTNIGGGSTDANLERSTSRESGKRTQADIAMPGSQSLRKTFSTTSGFIGSSPFRTAGEHERKKTFFPASTVGGTTSATGHAMDLLGMGALGMGDKKAKNAHRASNTPNFASLSASLGRQADTEFAPAASEVATSPRPVKMLNGRVYGKNRQAEAAQQGTAEPEFVEWGGMMGQKGGGIGSIPAGNPGATPAAAPSSSFGSVGGSTADDDDDGSGMGWVKRRREQRERERRASEAGFADESPIADVFGSGQARHVGSLPTSSELHKHWQRGDAQTVDYLPSVNEDRVATPINTDHSALPPPLSAEDYPDWHRQDLSQRGRLQALDIQHGHDDPGHIVQAVQIPGNPDEAVRWRNSFQADEGEYLHQHETGAINETQIDDYEEEEDGENDFESDDEEELAIEEEKKRQTSSAAGVEVVSRHRD